MLCHVTSRVDGDPHQQLLREKGGRGFPYLVFMDERGEVIATQRERTVAAFEKTRAACMRYLELQAKAAAGDASVGADLLLARIEMGNVGLEEAREIEAGLGKVPAEQRARIFQAMIDLEVGEQVKKVRTRKQAIETGRELLDMWGQGRVPKGDFAPTFYALIMETAYADGDAKTYARALKKYEKLAPEGASRARVIARMRKRLDEIRQRPAAGAAP